MVSSRAASGLRLALEETAMMVVAAAPLGSLLMMFFAVPAGIVAGIVGTHCITSLRHRPRKP